MTWSYRRASWRDAESIAALAVAGVGLTAAAPAVWLPERLIPACAFKTLTGRPCFTCGALRALRALMAGDPGAALRLQPLLTLAALAACGWIAYAAAGPLLELPRLQPHPTRRERRLFFVAALVLPLANWAYLLANGR